MCGKSHFYFLTKNLNKFVVPQSISLSTTDTHRRFFNSRCLPPSVRHSLKVTEIISTRPFHNTKPKAAIPPIFLAILRSLVKVIPVMAGRGVRNWWRNLPGDKRQRVLKTLKEHRSNTIKGGLVLSGFSFTYYYMHLVEDPITKRKRFIIVSNEELEEMSDIESKKIIVIYKKQIVKSGPQYDHVLKISKKLLKANKTIPGVKRSWQVILIDDVKTRNAFVLPSGHIFVFSGIIAATSNEDQLAVVVGHEIAHVLLQHSAEELSRTYFLQILVLIPFIMLWALLPGGLESISQRIAEHMSNVLITLPFSRKLETEADILGLEMMARACYDPRQAPAFWRKLDELSNDNQIEWFSTHPSHKTRVKTLEKLISKVLRIRTKHCSNTETASHDHSPPWK